MHHTAAWSWLEMLLIAEERVYCIRFDRSPGDVLVALCGMSL